MVQDNLISVIIPVYKCEGCLIKLVEELDHYLSKITNDYEVILVNDNSPDSSWDVIKNLASQNQRIKGLKLSKNFGQHRAITAGLYFSKGEYVVVMDCDLQDKPEEIVKLYNELQKGYDMVLAEREQRQDTFFKKLYSKLFYKVLVFFSGMKYNPKVGNFGIYKRKVIDTFLKMPEQTRIFSVMMNWVGFKKLFVPVQHGNRLEGGSSYNFSKLLNLAIDIILSYSNKPLKLIVAIGIFTSLISVFLTFYFAYSYFVGKILVSGYTSIIIAISFFSGIIISMLGIIGLYIAKIFDGIKNRPLYIVEDTINL